MNKIEMKLNSSVLLPGDEYKELNKGEIVVLISLLKDNTTKSKINAVINTKLYGDVTVCFSLLEPVM